MKLAIFESLTAKQYFIDESNQIWMHGTLLCNELGFSNPSEAITKHTDEDERRKEEVDGRLVWFVSEPGVWGMILAAKTPEAKAFKRKLKHEILPKLRAEGYYIARTDSATLERLEADVTRLQAENALLLSGEFYEKAADLFVRRCLIFQRGSYILGNDLVAFFQRKFWTSLPPAYQNIPVPDGGEILKLVDSKLKRLPAKVGKRPHISAKNGFGDIENALLGYFDRAAYSDRLSNLAGIGE